MKYFPKSSLTALSLIILSVAISGCNGLNSEENTKTNTTKINNQFYYGEQTNGLMQIKSAPLASTNKISKLLKNLYVDASKVESGETVMQIDSTGKAIKVLPDGSLIVATNLNEHKSAESISIFNTKNSKLENIYKPKDNFLIDDFIINPSGNLIATWEVKKSPKGKLLGGESRVMEIDLKTNEIEEIIPIQRLEGDMNQDDTSLAQYFVSSQVCLQHPIFYDNSDSIYLDTFCPNTIEGTGWGAGIHVIKHKSKNAQKSQMFEIGNYSYRPSISSDGKKIAVVRPKNRKFSTLEASWEAQQNPDSLYVVDVVSGEETLLFESDDTKISAQPVISNDGKYIGITTFGTNSGEEKAIALNTQTKKRININVSAEMKPCCFDDDNYLVFAHYDSTNAAGISYMGDAPNSFLASTINYVNPKTGKIEKEADFPDNDPPNGEIIPTLNKNSEKIEGSLNAPAEGASKKSSSNQQQIIAWMPDESQIASEKKAQIFHESFTNNDCTDNCKKTVDPNSLDPDSCPQDVRNPEACEVVELPDGRIVKLSTYSKPTGEIDPVTGFEIATPSELMKWKWEHSKEMTLDQCNRWIKSIGGVNTFEKSKKNPEIWKLTYENAQYFNCFDSPLYLYPKEKKTVKIESENIIFNTYPKTETNGWTVEAKPDGTIIHQNEKYNSIKYDYKGMHTTPPKNGVVVRKEQLSNSLRTYANNLGLNKTESDEFVMFFTKKLSNLGPYIQISHYNMGDSEKILNLKIEPKPDTFIPIVMYFREISTPLSLKEPTFDDIPERTGFTVVDWSGKIE
ncbi:MAG: hypothetical protein BWY43_00111 [candidate division WS2 bacterium ADurb.Bin280]|uniref:Translocation protein TolB n=1 Tax=candidate division WS2 bacterium ADurb.Bin280 TaxID=1852829 RepID=A0A1V5SFW2_9BACT|nr:MAG: hypothetical protein BWY43_00111 [candidate division WS2 bacterium ADurb.Bin280]